MWRTGSAVQYNEYMQGCIPLNDGKDKPAESVLKHIRIKDFDGRFDKTNF